MGRGGCVGQVYFYVRHAGGGSRAERPAPHGVCHVDADSPSTWADPASCEQEIRASAAADVQDCFTLGEWGDGVWIPKYQPFCATHLHHPLAPSKPGWRFTLGVSNQRGGDAE
jgi:hypothetical protein